MRMKMQKPRGFTLIELIVVLALLAIFATMALTATSGITDQARFEETVQTFNKIETAIFGSAKKGGSSHGFIADIGRFPTLAGDPRLIGELLAPQALPEPAPTDPYSFGWKGPYIQRAFSDEAAEDIKDGWGNSMYFSEDVPARYFEVRSLGPNGIQDFGNPSDDLVRTYPIESCVSSRLYFNVFNHSDNPVEIWFYAIYPEDGNAEDNLYSVEYIINEGLPGEEIIVEDHFTLEPGQELLDNQHIIASAQHPHITLTGGLRALRMHQDTGYPKTRVVQLVCGGSQYIEFEIHYP